MFGGVVAFLLIAITARAAARLDVPPAGKLYQGLYLDEPAKDHDPTEHDIRPADVARFENAIGKKAAWVFFSDNWFEDRAFPAATCAWIRDLGKVPYVRLMLRSDTEQQHAEKLFTLANIIGGRFDDDLRAWARAAKAFGSPILIEWGTEPNGFYFPPRHAPRGYIRQMFGPGVDNAIDRYIVPSRELLAVLQLWRASQQILFRYDVIPGPKAFETQIHGRKFEMYNDTVLAFNKSGKEVVRIQVEEPIYIRPAERITWL